MDHANSGWEAVLDWFTLFFEGRCRPGAVSTEIFIPSHGGETNMAIYVNLSAIAALIAGILILIIPRLLNYIVAIYLILIGIVGLIH
jgi:hypothetical protein